MLDKILIANRGEIACRIIRTARAMGLRTVAVYSDADRHALHVEMADEGYRLGGATASASYLNGESILAAAARSGAHAVHPGYGFLAENDQFAEACAGAGLIFVGPPPAAIRAMGSKSRARALMDEAGVPIVPGYQGTAQSERVLREAAEGIGYPVLVKPSAGGGGKGMRVVGAGVEFDDALAGARREARAAFGDDAVILEKFLTRARHVEIQVFADTHGNVLHLFERDCSLQRRHQKVIEEAPAPGLGAALRERMGSAAVTAARAIGYVGAGTIEFLLAPDGEFYFMEMNTRLQVEHPVTEMITGLDLVEWQIRVAAGEALPWVQHELGIDGHAIEARIYAEDPAHDFLPATGRLRAFRTPAASRHVRIDTGVRAGDTLSIHYDPMIAKLVVWDRDRTRAIRRLDHALADCHIAGVTTNVAFLAALVAHRDYRHGALDTVYIDRHRDALLPGAGPVPDDVLAVAALHVLEARAGAAREAAEGTGDPFSPWAALQGWRLNDEGHDVLHFIDPRAQRHALTVRYGADGSGNHGGSHGGYRFELPSGTLRAEVRALESGVLQVQIGATSMHATVVAHGRELTVFARGGRYQLTFDDPDARSASQESLAGSLTAPMPGRIVAVMVTAGQQVGRGERLLVLEAMKMEHAITAPADGTVQSVRFGEGDVVEEGAELLTFEPSEGEDEGDENR